LIDLRKTVRSAEAYAYHKDFVDKTPELYQPETLTRLRADAAVETSAYIHARRQVDEIRRPAAAEAFKSVDVTVTPTTPIPPPLLTEVGKDMDTSMMLSVSTDRNAPAFNLYGWPTISVPCGFTRGGLPIGLQISGPPGGDAVALRLARAYEQATDWHSRRPSV
jgi:Asp-tRNA(Asn)/Glu-tRNA(Gln) amidotransferase A subunit family amidase